VATKKAATKKAAVRKGAAKKTAAKKRARVAPGAPLTQDLYTGMSGQFAAMSEFLWRGYNVAIPAVDVGEDIFVVEAENNVLRRVQVKTAGTGTRAGNDKTVQFGLSRGQLNLPAGGSELYFMLLTRWDDVDPARAWRFILIRSDHLNRFRLTPPAGVRRRGRPPLADATAGDDLTMKVLFTAADATAWGHSMAAYLDCWSAEWPVASPMRARVQAPLAVLAAAAAGAPGATAAAPLVATPVTLTGGALARS